jgi:hypothetical protein
MLLFTIRFLLISFLYFSSVCDLKAVNKKAVGKENRDISNRAAGKKARENYLAKLGIFPESGFPSKTNATNFICNDSFGQTVSFLDEKFLSLQAMSATNFLLMRNSCKDASNFIQHIDFAADEIIWPKMLNGSSKMIVIEFMEQIELEFGQINWASFLDLLPKELDFCLQQSYRFEVGGEAAISFFWLFCYTNNIFPLLKNLLLVADKAVKEAFAKESLAKSLVTHLSISDVAQSSSNKKTGLCQFIDEISEKLEQLMTQAKAAQLVQEALQKFSESGDENEPEALGCDSSKSCADDTEGHFLFDI